ncbi:MAG: universal stress protein [Planctomycetes bacterium]|nr:universal stress protein [Planctomycetota bacterium]
MPSPGETEEGKKAMHAALERLVPADAAGRGITTHLHLVDAANPSMAIADAFAAKQAELVVMGTHGRTGLVRFALGSVASDVMKRGVPTVLVFDPPPED